MMAALKLQCLPKLILPAQVNKKYLNLIHIC